MIEQFDDIQIVVAESATGDLITPDAIVPTADIDVPSIKRVVSSLARGLSTELRTLKDLAPSEVEVVFSLALSGELKAWVIGAKGEQTFSVTLKWKGGVAG